MTSPSRCLDLLRLQIEASLDERARIVDCFGVTIASCEAGQALWIGNAVPDATAAELAAVLAGTPPPADVSAPPPALAACEQIFARAGGPVERSGGPSYVFPPDPRWMRDAPGAPPGTTIESSAGAAAGAAIEPCASAAAGPRPADAQIDETLACSGDAAADRWRSANPGNWHPVEWDELLDGRLGPWAFAVRDERVISICHTPGPLTARAAECGVWTEPAFRGRGLAAATAVAWAALVGSPARTLFYSTDADNRSSQRVAQRLGLVPIGWTWRLHRPRQDGGLHVHPLCSLHVRDAR